MSYFPIPVPGFGGLNLSDDPGDVGFGGAIDLCDVELDRPGTVRERDRFSTLVANTSLTSPTLVGWGNNGFIASTASSVKLYTVAGALVGTAVAPNQYTPGSVQAFGTPAASYLYMANSTTNSIRRLTTAGVISAPSSMPTALYLGRTATDNRLVAGYTSESSQRVRFSNAGNAESWGETAKAVTGVAATGVFTSTSHGYNVDDAVYFIPTAGGSGLTAGQLYFVNTVPSANTFTVAPSKGGSTVTFSTDLTAGTVARDNNYVDLDPGDGGNITGMGTYGGQLIVFKEDRFFVFYGESSDASGNPVFNYRAVRNGEGSLGYVSAAEDGVYFYGLGPHGYGVFHTTGGPADEVSRPIRRILPGGVAPATFAPGVLTSTGGMAHASGRIFLVGVTAVGTYLLSYNIELRSWSVTQVPASTRIASTTFGDGTLIAASTGASAAVHQLDPTNTSTDSLRTPTPVYQSGFESLAPPRRYIDKYGFGPSRKRIRAWRVKGTGAVTMAVAADYGSTTGATALTLGTSPAVAETRYARAIRGSKISYRLSGTGPWTVNELVAFLADTRGVAEDISGDQ